MQLDLGETLALAEGYRAAAEQLKASPMADLTVLNDGLKALTRIVNPVLFTVNGPYEMDPALQMGILPGLAPVQQLVNLDPESDEYRFLRTKLVRQRNRVADALRQATELARSLTA